MESWRDEDRPLPSDSWLSRSTTTTCNNFNSNVNNWERYAKSNMNNFRKPNLEHARVMQAQGLRVSERVVTASSERENRTNAQANAIVAKIREENSGVVR